MRRVGIGIAVAVVVIAAVLVVALNEPQAARAPEDTVAGTTPSPPTPSATPTPAPSPSLSPSPTIVPEPSDRPPVIVPEAVAARPALPWCGHEVVQRLPEGDIGDAAVRRCWLDAYAARTPAEFVTDGLTIEGGRVREFYRALDDGTVEVITDWTADPFSNGGWTTMRCAGIHPLAVDPAGAEAFAVHGCADERMLEVDADSWPSTDELRLLDNLARFARTGDPDAFARLPFAEEVALGLADEVIAMRSPPDLADPGAWRLEADGFRARVGPFSALDPLVDWDRAPPGTTIRELNASVGPHAHCTSPAVAAPPELTDLRRIGLQPLGQPCASWWTVDLFLAPDGTIAAITLDYFEP